jgi:probable phosphoglycerate mutase
MAGWSDHTLYLLRHGETDWNREQRFQGQTDIPLNDLGRSQARHNGTTLKKVLGDAKGYRFVASPLSRTRETMEIARRAMELEPSAYDTDARLIEVAFGQWEAQTLPDLERQQPQAIAERDADKWNHVPPGGESYAMLAERVAAFLDDNTMPAVIVAHGGVIRAFRHFFEPGEADIVTAPVPQDRVYCVRSGRGAWLD